MDSASDLQLSVVVLCGTDPVRLVGTLVDLVEKLADTRFEVVLLVAERAPVSDVLDGLDGDLREVRVTGMTEAQAWEAGSAAAAAPTSVRVRAGDVLDDRRLPALLARCEDADDAGPGTLERSRGTRPPTPPDVVVSWLQHDYGQLGRPAESLAHALLDEGLARRVVYLEPPQLALPAGRIDITEHRRLLVVRTGPADPTALAPAVLGATGLHRPLLLNCGVAPENLDFLTGWAPLCARTALVTHDVLHLWPGMDEARSRMLARVRQRLHRGSDVTLGLSTGSVRDLPGAVYLGHGRDAVWSDPAVDSLPEPPELAAVPHPRVLYFGALTVRINVAAMRALADSGTHVVLVGFAPDAAVAELIAGHPRVHFLGPRAPGESPAYLRHVDAGIVPHTAEPFTASMEPHKLYNYASAGLRSVTTHVTVPEPLRDVVVDTSDTAEFVQAVGAAVRAGHLDGDRVRRARALDWASVARGALQVLLAGEQRRRVS